MQSVAPFTSPVIRDLTFMRKMPFGATSNDEATSKFGQHEATLTVNKNRGNYSNRSMRSWVDGWSDVQDLQGISGGGDGNKDLKKMGAIGQHIVIGKVMGKNVKK